MSSVRRPAKHVLGGLVVLLLALLGPRAAAQDGEPLTDVVLDGQVGVSHDLLRANLRTKSGVPYDPAVVDEDVRWLADVHGILAEVMLEPGPVARFRLSRIRRYDEVRFEGNVRYDTDELLDVARLTRDRAATPDEVRAGRELVRDHYLDEGYAFVQVDVGPRLDETGRRLAVLRVYEGPRVETVGVGIEGLTALDPDAALAVMRSPPGFWSWLVGKDFVRTEVDGDVVLLENFVRGEGYLDGRAALGPLEWNDDRTEVTVTMVVDQGHRYLIRTMTVEGASAVPQSELRAASPLAEGSAWRRPDIWRTLRAWKELYGKLGYLDARIEPVESFDESLPAVDVAWRITEGQAKTIRDVIVRGNHATRDDVVRRNLTVKPGDVADASELEWSEDVLVSLDWFTDFSGQPQVNVGTAPAPEPDQVDVIVDVNDESSGLFTFLVGAGSDSGLFGGASIDKRNFDLTRAPEDWTDLFQEFFGEGEAFHGGGQRLFFEVLPGTETTEIDILFQDPWLDSTSENPWGFSTELYDRTRFFSDYDRKTRGLAVSFDHRLSRQTSVWTGVRREDVDIGGIDEPKVLGGGGGPQTSIPTISKVEGTTTVQSLEGGFNYRRLDSLAEPTDGFAGSLRLEAAGDPFGGDVDLFRTQATGEWYLPLFENDEGRKAVLHPRIALGRVEERGDTEELPFFENFFVGGASGPFALRGFDFQGVGPHESGNAIGGRLAGVFSLEALFPLLTRYNPFRDEDETLMKGVLFVDVGNVVDGLQLSDLGQDLRSSAGAGMRLRLPALGGITLSLDYALLINDQDDDETRALSFELSRRF